MCQVLRAGVVVRTATDADLERITDIKVRNWADTYSALVEPEVLAPFLDYEKQLAAMREIAARPATVLLVAEADPGGVTAFALAYPEQVDEAWLESLHVLREVRSRGFGTLLMRATAVELWGRGYRSLRLGVVAGNAAAAHFYARLGGAYMGREPTSWAPGVWHEIYRWPDLEALV
jgi:GNAT superfamily N-acetyltransferase